MSLKILESLIIIMVKLLLNTIHSFKHLTFNYFCLTKYNIYSINKLLSFDKNCGNLKFCATNDISWVLRIKDFLKFLCRFKYVYYVAKFSKDVQYLAFPFITHILINSAYELNSSMCSIFLLLYYMVILKLLLRVLNAFMVEYSLS